MRLIDENKKVMVTCPTSIDKKYCQDEWLEWIMQLTYPNSYIYIIDNSERNNENAKYIDRILGNKGKCTYYKPKNKYIRHTILACYKRMYEFFIKNNFDYYFSLESDVFPPLNIIEHLIALDKKVVGLPYFHYEKEKTKLMLSSIDNIGGVHFSDYFPQQEAYLMKTKGNLINAYQSGIGCLLIKKEVIKKTPFRLDDRPMSAMGIDKEGNFDSGGFRLGFPDHFFHVDLKNAGIPVLLDTRYYCIHHNTGMRWMDIYKNKNL